MVARVESEVGVGGGVAAEGAAEEGGAGGEEEPLREAAEFAGEEDEGAAGEAEEEAFAVGDVHVQVAVEFGEVGVVGFSEGLVGKGHTGRGLYGLIRMRVGWGVGGTANDE